MKIILTGGGTGGPVAPLLAISEVIKIHNPEVKFFWLGTDTGPERAMVTAAGIKFEAISCGKFRRYFSWQNFTDLFKIATGFFQAAAVIRNFKPDLILSASGYVSVPVIWAGWFLKVPAVVHQQDFHPVLAVKLIRPFVKLITVAFKDTGQFLTEAQWIGQPVRQEITLADFEEARNFFKLDSRPVVLVTGGGTGAQNLNQLLIRALPKLLPLVQVIHLTGKGKSTLVELPATVKEAYKQFEFLNQEMAQALVAADLVVSRAGASAVFEMAVLGKPTILIPLPDSPQVANAQSFAKAHAAIVLDQNEASPDRLAKEILNLVKDVAKRTELSQNIKKLNASDAGEKFFHLVNEKCLKL